MNNLYYSTKDKVLILLSKTYDSNNPLKLIEDIKANYSILEKLSPNEEINTDIVLDSQWCKYKRIFWVKSKLINLSSIVTTNKGMWDFIEG